MANKAHGGRKKEARMEAGINQDRDPGDANLSWPGGGSRKTSQRRRV